MAAEALQDTTLATELDAEIEDLVEQHGGWRPAMRFLLLFQEELLRQADRATSRGYLRGLFSEGARPGAESTKA